MAIEVVPKSTIDKKPAPPKKNTKKPKPPCPTPAMVIKSIAFYDGANKIPGIDKEGKVILKIESENPDANEFYINLSDSNEIEFEYDGEKITEDDYLKLNVDSEMIEIELMAGFKY